VGILEHDINVLIEEHILLLQLVKLLLN
jgi:hypothetical protein